MTPHSRLDNADWSHIPLSLHHEIERWINNGIAPTSPFLGDILVGDLRRACSRVPERQSLFAVVDFLGLHAPIEAWGNASNCTHWARLRGACGIAEMEIGGSIYDNSFDPQVPNAYGLIGNGDATRTTDQTVSGTTFTLIPVCCVNFFARAMSRV